MDIKDKKILVIGAGISGNAAAKLTKELGAAEVILSDSKAEKDLKWDFAELREAGVKLVFGPQENSLLEGVDLIIMSPAVPVRIPLIQEAYKRGIKVTSEV